MTDSTFNTKELLARLNPNPTSTPSAPDPGSLAGSLRSRLLCDAAEVDSLTNESAPGPIASSVKVDSLTNDSALPSEPSVLPSGQVDSLTNDSAEVDSLANEKGRELILANESTFGADDAASPRREGLASREARQVKEAASLRSAEVIRLPGTENLVASAPRQENFLGGEAASEKCNWPPGGLIKQSTAIKVQLWDNGFQKKRGRARFKAKLYGWHAKQASEINPIKPDVECSVALPATLKEIKRGLRIGLAPGPQKDLAKWGIAQVEEMNEQRVDNQPHALFGWPQLPNDIAGTQRDYDYVFIVGWTLDDGDWLPQFFLYGVADPAPVLHVTGIESDTFGKPKAPWWLGYHDTVGYNEFRKTRGKKGKTGE